MMFPRLYKRAQREGLSDEDIGSTDDFDEAMEALESAPKPDCQDNPIECL